MHEDPGAPGRIASPLRHQVPTHVLVEDKLLSVLGVHLTLRQTALLLLGGGLSVALWKHLSALAPLGAGGLLLRLSLSALPCVAAVLLAFLRPAGRTPEAWLLVLGRYLSRPHLALWRPGATRLPPERPASPLASNEPGAGRDEAGDATNRKERL